MEQQTTKEIGRLGESIAARYLIDHGYSVVESNYWRKWGELDLIVKRDGVVHFVEVKTVSYETRDKLNYAISHETWRPEEQVHQFKLRQIRKALETWIIDREYEGEWTIDVVAVRVVPRETFATVRVIENITLD